MALVPGLDNSGSMACHARIMLVHTVFFWLKPGTTEAQRADFRRGLETLKGVKSVEQVHVGVPAPVAPRPVTDLSFSFCLTVLCRDMAAHDAYQIDPLHQAFLAQFKPMWEKVVVYDAI